ncbi:unnamed protein product, partial [marine sediment metagenome]
EVRRDESKRKERIGTDAGSTAKQERSPLITPPQVSV